MGGLRFEESLILAGASSVLEAPGPLLQASGHLDLAPFARREIERELFVPA